MKVIGDFHVHSTFCDGANTPEEMALTAIDRGMTALGFSSHSPMPFEVFWCMKREWLEKYKTAVAEVKEKYRDKLTVLTGIELDYYSDIPTEGFDYIISSAHYIKKGEDYLPTDYPLDTVRENIEKHYAGDPYPYVRDYYETVSHLGDRGKVIIGHYDVVAKFNRGNVLFDEDDPRVRSWAMEALEHLCTKDVVFEINTGALNLRGYPYPSPPYLRRLRELGGRVIITGDTHRAENLGINTARALEYVKEMGFCEIEQLPPRFEG